MNASKEQAMKAIETLENIKGSSSSSGASSEEWQAVFDFMSAAARKLPSEAAYERAKNRKK